MTDTNTPCPVETIARDIAAIYRAQAMLNIGEKPAAMFEDDSIIADWSSSVISRELVDRADALRTLARTLTPKSHAGACFHLMCAFSTMPVSEILPDVWTGNEGEKRKALAREWEAEQAIERALEHLMHDCEDEDLLLLKTRIGPPEGKRAGVAVMDLIEHAKRKAA